MVVKKPSASGRETPTETSTETPSPSRPTPRASTPSSASSPSGAGVARTLSSRKGNPVSARVAAHQRRGSMLSNGTSINGKGASSPDIEREEALRAETVAIIDDLKERLAQAEAGLESYKRQAEVLQSKLDDALKEQAKLEERVHESEEQIEALTNEKRDALRRIREMETIYEGERSAMMKEKEEMANREEEMQAVIQRLKDSLAQRNHDEDRPSRQSVNTSPSIDGGSFAPPSSVHRSDSRNTSKLLLQKDKLIESLRLELAEAQIKLVESQNQGGGRLQEVERQLMEARVANARLMEDNESYQLLLQERTLKGEFGPNDIASSGGASANQDALAALEGRSGGTSLANELSKAQEDDLETQRRLEAELRNLRDQNKALSLYINKIIERLLQHQGFEHILDQSNDFKSPPDTNKDLPPPPPSKPTQGPSLLQRAKTMTIGGSSSSTAPSSKPRPVTMAPSAGQNSAISNPETAPSIPIGPSRSASVRRSRPMSEQFTSVPGAAAIVNAMYKGPSTTDGPLSPSFRTGPAFFPQGAGNRTSGGGGNFPGMKSETSSTSGDSASVVSTTGGGADGASTPPSQASPPRSTHHHEKTTTLAGNKPRPLRLVQEKAEEKASANRRQSWVGWAASLVGKRDDSSSSGGGGGVGEAIKE
ncbi:hypothetical protein VTH82DRAFT_5892 [Thermothelomyces myriococcoides]